MNMFETTFSKGELNGKPTVKASVKMPNGNINIHFVSTEHILTFMEELMKVATEVWPDDQWVKEYQEG